MAKATMAVPMDRQGPVGDDLHAAHLWWAKLSIISTFLGVQLTLQKSTLPETNMFAPENGWLEYYFPIGEACFQGLR